MKRLFSFLCLIFAFNSLVSALPGGLQDEFDQVVFDVRLVGGDEVFFGLVENEEDCVALFYDGGKAELNILTCVAREYGELKKLAYGCKLLVKSVATRSDYERKSIHDQIVAKLKEFAKFKDEDYDTVDKLGFVKINWYETDSFVQYREEFAARQTKKAVTKLSAWSYNDNLKNMLDDFYKPAHEDVDVDFVVYDKVSGMTGPEDYMQSLDSAFAKGSECPDVFSLDSLFVRKYVESGYLLPLDDVYEELKDELVEYPVKIGSYDGHVYALSWLMTPGAMFYRRSLAKKYLGTDDPDEVQKYFCDTDKMLETARLLKDKSNGSCRLVASSDDLFEAFLGLRKNPWMVDGNLNIDPAMEKYMDVCKIMHDEGLDGQVARWSEGWFSGTHDSLKDSDGNTMEIFSYFFPKWGLNFIIKPESPETSADWAMCEGPSAYNWGGEWLAAYKGTKNPEAVKEMIKYFVSNTDFLGKYVDQENDLPANRKVQDKIKKGKEDPYLAGQNPYGTLYDIAENVDGNLYQATDQEIEYIFQGVLSYYVRGKNTKQEVLDSFRNLVSKGLGIVAK